MKLRNKKTGEIVDTTEWTFFCDSGAISIENDEDANKEFRYGSLAELCEEWEDYKPTEPLIKDEKIRKAVRAWADGNNIESVHYDAFWRGFRRDNSSITVWEELPLEDNKVYTIAELCGEEEE